MQPLNVFIFSELNNILISTFKMLPMEEIIYIYKILWRKANIHIANTGSIGFINCFPL